MRSRPTGGSPNNAGMNATQIIVLATPVFFALMALEYAWGRHTGRNTYRLHDTLSSLALGVLSQLSAVFMVGLTLGLYTLVWRHAALWRANDFWLSLPGWLLALLFYDFCYYWLHRMGHEVALLWAAHVVHHQSQHYNLSTALRQTSSGPLLAWLFYLPMALAGVPPQQFAVVALIDLLYQFWIHTEHVPRLGWFDRVFASPSNHRVHHAVNDAYLDRNYGGILILWDRLFGTFREETEPCVYGTRSPLNSCNPLWANAEVYAGLLRTSVSPSARPPRWGDRLRLWFKPPGPASIRRCRARRPCSAVCSFWPCWAPRPAFCGWPRAMNGRSCCPGPRPWCWAGGAWARPCKGAWPGWRWACSKPRRLPPSRGPRACRAGTTCSNRWPWPWPGCGCCAAPRRASPKGGCCWPWAPAWWAT